jgi:hypothetical protein
MRDAMNPRGGPLPMNPTTQHCETTFECSCCQDDPAPTRVNTNVIPRQHLDSAALEETVPGFLMPDLQELID